jgi:hypothetical protein
MIHHVGRMLTANPTNNVAGISSERMLQLNDFIGATEALQARFKTCGFFSDDGFYALDVSVGEERREGLSALSVELRRDGRNVCVCEVINTYSFLCPIFCWRRKRLAFKSQSSDCWSPFLAPSSASSDEQFGVEFGIFDREFPRIDSDDRPYSIVRYSFAFGSHELSPYFACIFSISYRNFPFFTTSK